MRKGSNVFLGAWILHDSHLMWTWSSKRHLSLKIGWQTYYCWQNGPFQTLSLGCESPFWIAYSFFLSGLASQCATRHPVSWEDFIGRFLKRVVFLGMCVKRQNQINFFFLSSSFIFIWQRVDSQPKAFWPSWAWRFFLKPAWPICLCIYIVMTPWLLSFKHVMLLLRLGHQPLQGSSAQRLNKRCVRELKGKGSLGPGFFLDIITYCSPFLLTLLAGQMGIVNFPGGPAWLHDTWLYS